MLVYPSGVDVSSSALRFLSAKLRRRRQELGTRWRRLSAGRQALLTLAHLRNGHPYAQLAAGFGIGTTTAYRYITEAVEILAALAPTLAEAVRTASSKAFVLLDGTLLPIDRIAADRPYYSGKHKRHGMNVQVLADPSPCRPSMRCQPRRGRRRCHGSRAARTSWTAPGKTGEAHSSRPKPGCRRYGPHPVLGAVGDPVHRSAGGEPVPREDPRTRRAGHGHPQVLASPSQDPMLDHPDHQPHPSRPHPAFGQLRPMMEKPHCRWIPRTTAGSMALSTCCGSRTAPLWGTATSSSSAD